VAERGHTDAALSALDGQRKARQARAGGRRQASTLADLKAERAALVAKGRPSEAAAASIRHIAELIGAEADSAWAIQWLLALMTLYCNPAARAPTAAASARNRPQRDAALPKIMDDILQVAD
jgi:hypothetical protein